MTIPPFASERTEQLRTEQAREDHDEGMRSLRPIRREPVLYLDSSATARAVRFFARLAEWMKR